VNADYPIALRLEGRVVLVVGGGEVARAKGEALYAAGAHVRVVAPSVCEALAERAHSVERRGFRASDVRGAWFVVAAATPAVNARVHRAAERAQRFVVAVDDPAACSATGMALVRRAGMTVGISTGGAAPALASLVRRGLDALLPDELEAWTALAVRERGGWKAGAVPMAQRTPALLRALNALYLAESA